MMKNKILTMISIKIGIVLHGFVVERIQILVSFWVKRSDLVLDTFSRKASKGSNDLKPLSWIQFIIFIGAFNVFDQCCTISFVSISFGSINFMLVQQMLSIIISGWFWQLNFCTLMKTCTHNAKITKASCSTSSAT